MPTRRKQPVNAPADPEVFITPTGFYDSPGTPDLQVRRDEPSLDPALESARDAQAKEESKVVIDLTPPEPYLDPTLAKQRDEALKQQ